MTSPPPPTRAVLVAAGAILLLAGRASAQPATMSRRESLLHAQSMLQAKEFRRAEALYVAILPTITNNADRELRAAAFFGRALAAQQRITSGDTLDGTVSVDTVERAYRSAGSLSDEYRAAGQNNMAQMYHALGRHEQAARYLESAARSSDDTARVPFWLSAAREYEAHQQYGKALDLYEKVLDSKRNEPEAVRGLFRVLLARGSPNKVLEAANRWRKDSALAMVVVEAMPQMLEQDTIRIRSSDAVTALLYFASALPVARIGPAAFSATLDDRLRAVGAKRTEIAAGIEAIRDAYRTRATGTVYREPASVNWWRSRGEEPRAVWSSVLRWLGDVYYDQGAEQTAAGYYEAALGQYAEGIFDPAADRKALLPLALIYAKSQRQDASRLHMNVRNFTEALFSAKSSAYAKGDQDLIRELHTVLGGFYASQGKWTGPGAENAEFQLSRMRATTKEMQKQGKNVSDPPELLVSLANYYARSGRTAEAEAIKNEVRVYYTARRRPDRADSLFLVVDRPRVVLDTVPLGTPGMVPGQFAGLVIDSLTNRPLAGVRVLLIGKGEQFPLTTDERGEFTVRLQPLTRDARLIIRVDGYAPFERTVPARTSTTVRLARRVR